MYQLKVSTKVLNSTRNIETMLDLFCFILTHLTLKWKRVNLSNQSRSNTKMLD